MTGSTSNITTQWTFRDGRDYILSLNTTQTPNTISFWISDKITGEEWTCCYDENAIEVLTKRTGCFKSFQTFLSMIKSAMLKKSESVILDLLNLEDLSAISANRQNSAMTNGNAIPTPLNFQMYNGDINGNNGSSPLAGSVGSRPTKSPKARDTASTSSNKPSSINVTAMNKRKYLIVTYIAEFDKVHYPLPLNYSCPPDLSVMQNNIVNLKAEVTSLRSANKELLAQMETLRCGSSRSGTDGITEMGTSHENITTASASTCASKDRVKSSGSSEYSCGRKNKPGTKGKDSNGYKITRKAVNEEDRTDANANYSTDGSTADAENETKGIPTTATAVASKPCTKCLGTIESLQSKIRDLEDCIRLLKEHHAQLMENVENENHFLRHKVKASEKYEMELWNQIKELKEKVVTSDGDLDKEIKSPSRRERDRKQISRGNQNHRSRHDMFYSSRKNTANTYAKRVEGVTSISPVGGKCSMLCKNNKSSNNDMHDAPSKSSCHSQSVSSKYHPSHKRSKSNSSTSSYRSFDAAIVRRNSKEMTGVRFSYVNKKECQNRRSGSSSRSNNSLESCRNQKSLSPSPSRRFDPTAYINEKRVKQSKIADMRMRQIETRIRSRSRSRIPRPTTSMRRAMQCDLCPGAMSKTQRSQTAKKEESNQNSSNVDSKERIRSEVTDYKGDSKNGTDSKANNLVKRRSRSSSICSGKTTIISTVKPAIVSRSCPRKEVKRVSIVQEDSRAKSNNKDYKQPLSNHLANFERRIIRSQAKTSLNIRGESPRIKKSLKNTTMSRTITPSTSDVLDPIFVLSDDIDISAVLDWNKKRSTGVMGQLEQNPDADISVLQRKLAALQTFLEACKPKPQLSSSS